MTRKLRCQWCNEKTVQNSMSKDDYWRCTKCGKENVIHVKKEDFPFPPGRYG